MLLAVDDAVVRVVDEDRQIAVAVALLERSVGGGVVLDLAVAGQEAHVAEATARHDRVELRTDGPRLRGDHDLLASARVALDAELQQALVHGLGVAAAASQGADRDIADLDEVDLRVTIECHGHVLRDGDGDDAPLFANDDRQRRRDHLADGVEIAEVAEVGVEGLGVDARDVLEVLPLRVGEHLHAGQVDLLALDLVASGQPVLVLPCDGLGVRDAIVQDAAEVGKARHQRVILYRDDALAADDRGGQRRRHVAPANTHALQVLEGDAVTDGHLHAESATSLLGGCRDVEHELGHLHVGGERLQEQTAVTRALRHHARSEHAAAAEDQADRGRRRQLGIRLLDEAVDHLAAITGQNIGSFDEHSLLLAVLPLHRSLPPNARWSFRLSMIQALKSAPPGTLECFGCLRDSYTANKNPTRERLLFFFAAYV